MKRILVALASAMLGSAGLVVVVTATPAQADNHQISICHATGNPGHYSMPNPTKQQIFNDNGHNTGDGVHPGDIIPPFEAGEHGGQEWGAFAGQNWDAEGQEIYNNGCEVPAEECPEGDFNGEAPGCGEAPPECPDGDFNGDEPGCGQPPPPPPAEVTICHALGDGNFEPLTISEDELADHLAHGDLATVPATGCPTAGGPPPPPPGEVGGISETRVEHRFRCGQAIRIERMYEDGVLVDVERTVTPTGEDCSPAELRISPDVWERSHVEETGL